MADTHSYTKWKNEPSGFIFDYGSAFDYRSINKYNVQLSRIDYTYDSTSCCEDLPVCRKEPWASVVLRHSIFYLCCLLGILFFPICVFLCIKKVHSLERLVVFRLGRLEPVKGPGFVVVIPFVDHWTRVDLHPKQLTVSTPQILTVDGGIVEVTAEISYRVSDVLHYVTKSENPVKSVLDLSTCCLVNIISGKEQSDLENVREIINDTLKVELNSTVVKWGVEVVSISLKPVKVLKAAEPVTAISTLISALKSFTEQSSVNLLYSGIANKTSENVLVLPAENVEPEVVETSSHIISVLQHFASSAVNKEKVKDVSAIFQLKIVSATPQTAYIILHDGNISVLENSEFEQNSDVSVVVPETVLLDILNGKTNALDAYLEGKITISGNWVLLNTLSDLLS